MKILYTCLIILISFVTFGQSNLPIKEKYDYLTGLESVRYFNNLPQYDEANFGEGWSKIIDGYLNMYKTTGDKGYLYRFIQESLQMMSNRHDVSFSNLAGEGFPKWTFSLVQTCNDFDPTPLDGEDPVCYNASTYLDGDIAAVFAKFTYIVKQDMALFNTDLYNFNEISPNQNCVYCTNYTGINFTTFGDYANWLQNRVGETLYWFIDNGYWDETDGLLQTFNEGSSFKVSALNKHSGFVRALMYNGLSAGNQDFIDKATAIAQRMKGDIVFTHLTNPNQRYEGPWLLTGTDHTYRWYQRGWNDEGNYTDYINGNLEDMSHGAKDVIFFEEIKNYLPNSPITEDDMVRFHNTFTRRLYDGEGGFYGTIDGSDLGYDAVNQSSTPINQVHSVFKYASLLYSFLGAYETGVSALNNNIDGKSVYEIAMNHYQNDIHSLMEFVELNDLYAAPGVRFSLATGAVSHGHSTLVNQQWKRECTDLVLFKRKVVYNQDFWAQGLLTVAPSSLSSMNSSRSFALPHITTEEFTIVPNVVSELRGGDGVTLKSGFSAKKGCNVTVVTESVPCVKSAYLTSTNSITETSQQYSIKKATTGSEGVISESKPSLECFIYPNPSTGLFNAVVSDNFKNGEYHVFDMLGRIIFSGQVFNNRLVVDLSGKEKGVYTIQFVKNENMVIQKVIKQ